MKWLIVVGLFALVPNVQAALFYEQGFEGKVKQGTMNSWKELREIR